MMRGLERKSGRINTKELATQSRGRIRRSLKWRNLIQVITCLQLTQDRRRYRGGQLLQALDVGPPAVHKCQHPCAHPLPPTRRV